MADHTPTPWGLNKYNELVDAAGENIRAKGFALTNTAEAHHNTAFIHRAVNAHDDLVNALEAVRDNLVRLAWDENSIMVEGIDKVLAKVKAAS